jgi:hypothetical protein
MGSWDIRHMNREMIRQQLVGQKPLTIRTSDGKVFPVPHPEFVLVGRHNIVIEDEKGLLDIIDPLHVVSIRPGSRRKTHKLAP